MPFSLVLVPVHATSRAGLTAANELDDQSANLEHVWHVSGGADDDT